MKLIGRTSAIIIAALLVCGVTYALGNAGLLGSGRGGEFRDRQFAGQTAGAQAGTQAQPPQRQFPEGFEGRGRGEREGGGGLFGLFEVGKSFVIIALIVAVVASAQSMIRRRWPKKGARLTETRL